MKFNLNKVILALLISCSLLIGDALAVKWKAVDATTGEKTNLTVNGKESRYYKIDSKNSVTLKVTGPTTVKLITRTTVKDKKKASNYSIVSQIDSKKKKTIGRASTYTADVSLPKSKDLIAKSRTITYKIPAGEHVITFAVPKSAKYTVFARLSLPREVAKVNYVAFLPKKFKDEVRITVNESPYIYYRVTSASNVELEVNGPTTLKCLSRLEFDHTMRGDKPYRIQIRENGKVVRTKPHQGKVSASAHHTPKGDKLIGKGDNLLLKVPSGKHIYQLSTPDSGISVLLRFLLPENDLTKINHSAPKKNTKTG